MYLDIVEGHAVTILKINTELGETENTGAWWQLVRFGGSWVRTSTASPATSAPALKRSFKANAVDTVVVVRRSGIRGGVVVAAAAPAVASKQASGGIYKIRGGVQMRGDKCVDTGRSGTFRLAIQVLK